MKKWTKAEALQKFIEERVMGDVPLAYDREHDKCIYDHRVAGGCAIGCLLPPEIAESLQDNMSIAGIANNSVYREAVEPYLEDIHSNFWTELQMAHDELARNHHSSLFQEALRHAAASA
jgi:hypothetical protein